ncbi:MAG: hypothetical protein ABJL44_13625 [Algibacter sp.]
MKRTLITKNILILTITLLSIQIGVSQTIDILKLNNYFESLDLNNKFMGSVALLKNEDIVYTKQIASFRNDVGE